MYAPRRNLSSLVSKPTVSFGALDEISIDDAKKFLTSECKKAELIDQGLLMFKNKEMITAEVSFHIVKQIRSFKSYDRISGDLNLPTTSII